MSRGSLHISLALTITLFSACGGGGSTPRVGGNNTDDNSETRADMGGGSIFPDVSVNNTNPNAFPNNANNNMPDVGRDVGVDQGTPPPDMGQDMPVDMPPDMPQMMNCPRTDVALGQACGCNQECTSGVCVDATVDTDGFCSTACTTRSDCGAGEACVTDRFGTSVCREDDAGTNCGVGGQPMPDGCSAGYCVEAGSNFMPPNNHFCSVPCDAASDCQLGHACTPVRCQFSIDGYRCKPTVLIQRTGASEQATLLQTYSESTKLCVKVGDANPCTNVASDQLACAGSICDEAPVGRCTAQCVTTADCPAGGCVDYDLSDGTLPVRVCDL